MKGYGNDSQITVLEKLNFDLEKSWKRAYKNCTNPA